jgi:hypothetical protein
MKAELAQQIFARALHLCADEGIDDKTTTTEFVKIALGLVGAARGGPHMIPEWLDAVAAEMRANPAAVPTLN